MLAHGLTPCICDGYRYSLNLDTIDADGLHSLGWGRQLRRVQSYHPACRSNFCQSPFFFSSRGCLFGNSRRRSCDAGTRRGCSRGRGDRVLKQNWRPLTQSRFEEKLMKENIFLIRRQFYLFFHKDVRLHWYLRRWLLWCGDLQIWRSRLSLRDRWQRGGSGLHHLERLLWDLNHLGVLFGWHQLDLLHHCWLTRTLYDQEVVASLGKKEKRKYRSADIIGHPCLIFFLLVLAGRPTCMMLSPVSIR